MDVRKYVCNEQYVLNYLVAVAPIKKAQPQGCASYQAFSWLNGY